MDFGTSVIMIMVFIIVYVILIQIFTVLFRITGLTKEKAIFQSISLLTNCGFTTGESEVIASDKVRRRIAVAAMITGYAFSVVIVSLIINVLITLKDEQVEDSLQFIGLAFAVFVVVLIFSQLPFVKKGFEKLIEGLASLFLNRNRGQNVITLLDHYGKDAIAEIHLNRVPDSLVDKTIFESKIKDQYKINVLMLKRSGKVIDVTKDTIFKKNDRVVVFGSYLGMKNCFLKKQKETKKNVIELIEEYGVEAMAEVQLNHVPDFMKNKGLFESGLKSKYNINLLTIKRKDQIVNVTKDTVFEEKDTIVVFGPYVRIREVFGKDEEIIDVE